MNRSLTLVAISGAVLLALITLLAAAGCASVATTQAGPIEIGSHVDVPDRSVCIAEVPVGETVWFGERATNRSDHDVTVSSIEVIDAEGVGITSIAGRLMSPNDPHFMVFSEDSRDDPVFAGSVADLSSVDDQILSSGQALGIVVETELLAETASIRNIRITYTSEDRTYSSVSATTWLIASSQCGD